jgi:hypothetical protein
MEQNTEGRNRKQTKHQNKQKTKKKNEQLGPLQKKGKKWWVNLGVCEG